MAMAIVNGILGRFGYEVTPDGEPVVLRLGDEIRARDDADDRLDGTVALEPETGLPVMRCESADGPMLLSILQLRIDGYRFELIHRQSRERTDHMTFTPTMHPQWRRR